MVRDSNHCVHHRPGILRKWRWKRAVEVSSRLSFYRLLIFASWFGHRLRRIHETSYLVQWVSKHYWRPMSSNKKKKKMKKLRRIRLRRKNQEQPTGPMSRGPPKTYRIDDESSNLDRSIGPWSPQGPLYALCRDLPLRFAWSTQTPAGLSSIDRRCRARTFEGWNNSLEVAGAGNCFTCFTYLDPPMYPRKWDMVTWP